MLGGEERYRPLASVESFNRWTNQWKTLACLPFAVTKHSVVVSDSTLYLAGGVFSDGSTSREMWRYDPSHDDSWLKMAPMIYAHECIFSLVTLDGYVYAVGDHRAVNVERPHTRVQRYTPNTNTWQLVETPDSMISCYFSCGLVVVALDGLLYFIGVDVIREDGFVPQQPQMFSYNPNTNAWTEVASMQNIPRAGFVACTLKGKIYVMGGMDDDTEPMDRVECYDPETNQWTMCAPMKMPRSFPGVAVVDGMIYVLGGQSDEDRSQHTIERYCEDTDLWEMVGEMPTFRTYFGCVSLWLWKDALCELRGR